MSHALKFGRSGDSWGTRTVNVPTMTAFTVMGWIYPTNVSGSDRVVFAIGNTSGTDYEIFIATAGTWQLWNGGAQTGSTPAVANQWIHVCATVSGTSGSNYLLYLNGVLVTTHTSTTTSASPAVTLGSNKFAEPFVGSMSAVKIWNRVLTADEINAEMQFSVPFDWGGLNCFYSMPTAWDLANYDISDFGRPSTALSRWTDYSGQVGNDMTESGTIDYDTGPPIRFAPSLYLRRRHFLVPAGGGGTTLTPSAAVSTWTAPTPVLSAGGVTLTPTAPVSTWVVPAPVLSVGPLSLTPTAPHSTWTAPAPSLSVGGATLAPTAASSTWTVPTPVLAAGPLTLSPTAATSTWNAGAATIGGTLSLTPSAAVSTWTAGTASLSGGSNFTPTAAVSTWHAGNATLSAGPLTLTPVAPSSAWTVNTPALSPGALTLPPSAPHASWTVPAGVLSVGPLALAPSAPSSAWNVSAPGLAAGPVALATAAAVSAWHVPTPTFGLAVPLDWIVVGLFKDVGPRVAIAAVDPRVSLFDASPTAAITQREPTATLTSLELP